jgi:hypothetical protein
MAHCAPISFIFRANNIMHHEQLISISRQFLSTFRANNIIMHGEHLMRISRQ